MMGTCTGWVGRWVGDIFYHVNDGISLGIVNTKKDGVNVKKRCKISGQLKSHGKTWGGVLFKNTYFGKW